MQTSQKRRDPYFDNAKFILMVLVVFGHFLQPFIQQKAVYLDIYYFVYLFHMPAFVLIAGYFSKSYKRPGYLLKQAKKLLIPYVLLQWGYSLFYTLIGQQKSFSFDLIIPQWSLWFLLSLFCWNVLLRLFGGFKAGWPLGISVVLSLLVGYLPFIGRELALQRTFVFFPYFLLGYYLKSENFKILQSIKKRWALVVLALIYGFVYLGDIINKYWLFGSKPYEDYLALPELGSGVRFLIFCLALAAVFSVLSLIPTSETFFTKWGKNTLIAYLSQGIFMKSMRALGVDAWRLNWLGFFSLILMSFLLTCLLSSEKLQNFTGKVKGVLKEKIQRKIKQVS